MAMRTGPRGRCPLQRRDRGSIVILHDGGAPGDPDRGPTIAAIGRILEATAARGLTAVPASELAGLPAPHGETGVT